MMQYIQDYDEKYPPLPAASPLGVGAIIQPYMRSTQIFQCPQEFYRPETAEFASGDYSDYWFNARFYGFSDDKINSPASSITWGDGNTGAGEANAAYSLRNLPPNFAPSMRHRNGANYAFADGHVKWLLPRAISNTAPPGTSPTLVP
jgi:prepilin-type processing-associated H-X9-DG protein